MFTHIQQYVNRFFNVFKFLNHLSEHKSKQNEYLILRHLVAQTKSHRNSEEHQSLVRY